MSWRATIPSSFPFRTAPVRVPARPCSGFGPSRAKLVADRDVERETLNEGALHALLADTGKACGRPATT